MNRVALVSFGGWPDTFAERLDALATHVDEIVIFRARDTRETAITELPANVRTVDLDSERRVILFPVYPLVFMAYFLLYYYIKGERFDVVHSLDYFVGPACVALAGLTSGVGQVISLRGFPQQFLDTYREAAVGDHHPKQILLHYLLRYYYAIVLRSADVIVVKSSHQREVLMDLYSFDPPIRIIPTGVNLDVFTPDYDTDPRRIEKHVGDVSRLESQRPLVLYAGRLIPEKGPQLLLSYHCDETTVDSHLVMVGNCLNEQFRNELRTLSTGCDRTTLVDRRLRHGEIPNLIAWCDIVAMLPNTKAEGCPKILQESLAMNTPVITSDIDGIREELGDIEGCRLIDPNRRDAYTNALREIARSPPTVDRQRVVERFDIFRTYEQVADIYSRVSD